MTANVISGGGSFIAVGGGALGSGAPKLFDYYIATTGSDTNPGTLASPWAITGINSKQATYAGKRLGIVAGTLYGGTIVVARQVVTSTSALAMTGTQSSANTLDVGVITLEQSVGSTATTTGASMLFP